MHITQSEDVAVRAGESPGRDATAAWNAVRLPAPFRALDAPTVPPEQSGKVGVLDLGLSPVEGYTRAVRQFQRSPPFMFHPLYLDPCRPDMAFVPMLQAGDGLVQGDRCLLHVDCAPGAAAHITTQAATKVYRADGDFSGQLIDLTLAAGSYLEYLPEPFIPFRGSRYFQRLRLTTHPNASAIIGDILTPGRIARGETHAYELYHADVEARRPGGDLLFADVTTFEPAKRSPRSPAALGEYDVVGALYAFTHAVDPGMVAERLIERLHDRDDVCSGVTELPNAAGVGARILGPTSAAVTTAMRAAWDTVRRDIIGAPAPIV